MGTPMYQPMVSELASGESNRNGGGATGSSTAGSGSGSGAGSRRTVLRAAVASTDKPIHRTGSSHQEFSTESLALMFVPAALPQARRPSRAGCQALFGSARFLKLF